MSKPRIPRPPGHLQPPTRRWWAGIVSTFVFADRDLPLLTAAGEAWDRAREARAIVDREGLTITTKSGEVKRHPATGIEHDAMIRYARFMRELRLDETAPPDPSRPPVLRR